MAGDGKMLLTGVSKYVVRALVISMSLVLFRICETAAAVELVTKGVKVLRSEAWPIVGNDFL